MQFQDGGSGSHIRGTTWAARPVGLAQERSAARALLWLTVGMALLGMLMLVVGPAAAQAPVPLDPRVLTKYLDPLPLPPVMPEAAPSYYEIGVWQTTQPLHSQLPPTTVWGYGTSQPTASYPAATIEAARGTPNWVLWTNNLTGISHPLTVDQTLHWANPYSLPMGDPARMLPYAGEVPIVTHLHGGEVPSWSDGGPDTWFTPGWNIIGPGWASQYYYYPNTQEAATLWYHDHVLGMTRLNVYMGLAGFYLLRDGAEAALNLPGPAPAPGENPNDPANYPKYHEIPLVIQDRMFDTTGQWYFPNVGINPEHPYWLPEFLGNTILVNGKVWPYFTVEPRRYRFRMLNGSNARFYSLALVEVDPVTLKPLLTTVGARQIKVPGPAFWQIGTDGGLLDTPAKLNDPAALLAGLPSPRLLFAPGERADVIIDFRGYEGKFLLLDNTGRAPFPKGAPVDPQTTGQIMLIMVGLGPVADTSFNPATAGPGSLRPTSPIERLGPTVTPPNAPDVRRQLTLNEVMGPGGPLEILLNNTKWAGYPPHVDPMGLPLIVTEKPMVGSTEVWEIINLTADTHPIHLHLAQFQLLSRQKFQLNKYLKAYNASFPGGGIDPATGLPYPPGVYMPGYGPPLAYGTPGVTPILGGNPDVTLYLVGAVMLAAANEDGWKDTVQMNPGEVTRIAVRFAPQDAPAVGAGAPLPGQNLYAFDPSQGPGYVWHCHIIDHEDNEMMRPYTVQVPVP